MPAVLLLEKKSALATEVMPSRYIISETALVEGWNLLRALAFGGLWLARFGLC
jgi:hypothetical protein